VTPLERIKAFLRHLEERTCDEAVPTRHGVALNTPSLALVWQLNALRVDDSDADVAAVTADAERMQSELAHRKLVVPDEDQGQALVTGLAEEGWNASRLLVMVRTRPPARAALAGLGAEVSRERGAAALAAFRREQPFGWQDQAVEQLAGMDERFQRAGRARDFAAPADDPASACRLYSNGELAQIDEVGTLQARRRSGFASAAVLAAADAAAADGHDLVFLLTDGGDWPQHLYRRLGFDEIGAVYEFLKLPLGAEP
jgi:ribosomal protein S18 acetylase RimI-like enzyme